MGMGSNQVQLGRLTQRNHAILSEMQRLSMEAMSLTRNSTENTRNYKECMGAKIYKMSNNSGITYSDITYKTLMTPNINNKNNPILLCDQNGRIVVNSRYQELAKIISPDGSANPKGYENNRNEILASVLGVDDGVIETYYEQEGNRAKAAQALVDAEKNYNDHLSKEPLKAVTFQDILKKPVKKEKYTKNDVDDLLEELKTGIDSEIGIFDEDRTIIKNAIEGCRERLKDGNDAGNTYYKIDPNDKETDLERVKRLDEIDIDFIFENVETALRASTSHSKTNDNGATQYYVKGANWDEWNTNLEPLKGKVGTAKSNNEKAIDEYNINVDKNLLTQIEFFDQLFYAIADNGWKTYENVEDSEYLNQMLQNNIFYIMTASENEEGDEEKKNEFSYEIDLASNFDNFFFVNDTAKQNEALAEYEYKKKKISRKEAQIDLRKTNLETELNANKKMIETIKSWLKDNTETTMKLFT